MKYLGMNLPKYIWDFHAKNCVVKISILPKLAYRFNDNLSKSQQEFFVDIDKIIP